MKKVCLVAGVAALTAASAMAEFRTNDVNGVTMVYAVCDDGVRIGSLAYAEPSVASDTAGAIVIPEMVDGATVVSIGDYAFLGCSGVTSITLPNTITNIGVYAFSECAIAEIDLPSGLRSLGDAAFLNCKKLKSIVIPGGVACLSSRAGSVVEISSGSSSPGVSTSSSGSAPLGSSTWSTTTATSVTFAEGVFEGCSSLSSVVIQEGVREIGYRTFAKCRRLTEVALPSSVTDIAAGAFSECSSLKDVVLPEGLRCIGGSAFFCCKSLLRIVIPSAVEEVGEKAFGGCVSLQEVEFLGDEPSVGGWNLFTGTPSSLTVLVKKDALGWQDPITYGLLQTWHGRPVSYEGERVVSINAQGSCVDVAALVDSLVSQVTTLGASLSGQEKANYLYWLRDLIQSCPTSEEGFDYAGVIDAYMNAVTTLGVALTESEKASIISWTSEYVSKGVGGDTVVTNETSSGTSSGTSSSSGGVVAQTVAANLTVTNVVVHYVQEVENVASVAAATSGGLVAVVSEVLGSSMMSIPSSWTNSYPQFVEMYGDDFASALMKPSGKIGSDGAALQVWQDYVAGTDPTDPTSRFAATIDFVDGTPVVTWSPNVADGSRVYRIWGKKSLGDADWTQIDAATTADYSFFKVTVEMR